jgi:hypothetical protein
MPLPGKSLPTDPRQRALTRLVDACMDLRKRKIDRLLKAGKKRSDIVVVEHHGFPVFTQIDENTYEAKDASAVRIATPAEKEFTPPIKPGDIRIKHEIRNVKDVEITILEVKVGDDTVTVKNTGEKLEWKEPAEPATGGEE